RCRSKRWRANANWFPWIISGLRARGALGPAWGIPTSLGFEDAIAAIAGIVQVRLHGVGGHLLGAAIHQHKVSLPLMDRIVPTRIICSGKQSCGYASDLRRTAVLAVLAEHVSIGGQMHQR